MERALTRTAVRMRYLVELAGNLRFFDVRLSITLRFLATRRFAPPSFRRRIAEASLIALDCLVDLRLDDLRLVERLDDLRLEDLRLDDLRLEDLRLEDLRLEDLRLVVELLVVRLDERLVILDASLDRLLVVLRRLAPPVTLSVELGVVFFRRTAPLRLTTAVLPAELVFELVLRFGRLTTADLLVFCLVRRFTPPPVRVSALSSSWSSRSVIFLKKCWIY